MRTLTLVLSFIGISLFLNGQHEFSPGQVIDTVLCDRSSDHSYSVYLPTTYHPSSKWPVMYVLDAAGRGKHAAEIFQLAGETHGYVIIGSHNFKNGLYDLGMSALNVLMKDVTGKFSIDPEKVFISGLSGGARSAAGRAVLKEGIAGVIGFAAGIIPEFPIRKRSDFVWLGVVGDKDMNYAEMVRLQSNLKHFGVKNLLLTFEGPHEWPNEKMIAFSSGWMKLLTASSAEFENEPKFMLLLNEMINHIKSQYASGNRDQAIKMLESVTRYLPKTNVPDEATKLLPVYRADWIVRREYTRNDSLLRVEFEKQTSIGYDLMELSEPEPNLAIAHSKKKIKSFIQGESTSADIQVLNVYNRLLGYAAFFTFTYGNPFIQQKEYEKGLPYLEVWQATHPHSKSMAHYLAKVYALAGKRSKAIKMYKRSIELGLSAPSGLSIKRILVRLRDEKKLGEVEAKTYQDWL